MGVWVWVDGLLCLVVCIGLHGFGVLWFCDLAWVLVWGMCLCCLFVWVCFTLLRLWFLVVFCVLIDCLLFCLFVACGLGGFGSWLVGVWVCYFVVGLFGLGVVFYVYVCVCCL